MCFHEFIGGVNTRISLVIDWSRTTLYNVLLEGDKMYLEALNNGLIILDQGVELLFVDNLPKVVIASCCKDMFSYEIRRPVVECRHI